MSEDQSFHSFEYTPYLFSELSKIDKAILTDFGGGSPLPKTFIMAKVALQLHVKNYVEIGVYRGKSFFRSRRLWITLGENHTVLIHIY